MAAYLVGRDDDSAALWERAHHELLRRGDAQRAGRAAFWVAFVFVNRGDFARTGGWLARAGRVLDDGGHDCVERGYLLVPPARMRALEGDWPAVRALATEAAEIGQRFGDLDLVTLGRLLQGHALIGEGKPADGLALLDETMVTVTANEVSPIIAGLVYCATIAACQRMFDLRRAREWTAALSRWCEAQPELVPYSGQCLVHRAEIMHLEGAWPDAVDAAREACQRLVERPEQMAAGAGFYLQAELHRLRGEFTEAEEGYREASRGGASRSPGSRSCGWPRARSRPRRRRSAA